MLFGNIPNHFVILGEVCRQLAFVAHALLRAQLAALGVAVGHVGRARLQSIQLMPDAIDDLLIVFCSAVPTYAPFRSVDNRGCCCWRGEWCRGVLRGFGLLARDGVVARGIVVIAVGQGDARPADWAVLVMLLDVFRVEAGLVLGL